MSNTAKTNTPPGFWIVHISIEDVERYADYRKANAAVLERYGAVFLARGGRYEAIEGMSRQRHIVIQFRNYETASACYHDPEYQKAAGMRWTAADTDLVIVEGV